MSGAAYRKAAEVLPVRGCRTGRPPADLHPFSERRQERWASRTSRSSSVPAPARSEHWATILSREGRKPLGRALPNDEDCLQDASPTRHHTAPRPVKDAAVITQAASIMPQPQRAISTSDEDVTALSMPTGVDPYLAHWVNRTEGRLRGHAFTQILPSPTDLKRAGKARIGASPTPHHHRHSHQQPLDAPRRGTPPQAVSTRGRQYPRPSKRRPH